MRNAETLANVCAALLKGGVHWTSAKQKSLAVLVGLDVIPACGGTCGRRWTVCRWLCLLLLPFLTSFVVCEQVKGLDVIPGLRRDLRQALDRGSQLADEGAALQVRS